MKNRFFLSEILNLLKIFAPKDSALTIFDPLNQLVFNVNFPLRKVEKNSLRVLINLVKDLGKYDEVQLDQFDLIFDFSKSKFSNEFSKMKINYFDNPYTEIAWSFSKQNKDLIFIGIEKQSTLITGLIKNLVRLGFSSMVRSGSFCIYHPIKLVIDKLVSQVPYDKYPIKMGAIKISRIMLLKLLTNYSIIPKHKQLNTTKILTMKIC